MEVLRLHGYTEQEKLEIAKQYLVKKQREETGLDARKTSSSPTMRITAIIRNYTREAGVRNLEREIGNVCRKVARRVVKNGAKHKEEITGGEHQRISRRREIPRFPGPREERSGPGDRPCMDRSGRQILQTEVQVLDGKGKLTITGKLGDVMQESAQAALSYIRSRAQHLG